MGNTGVENIDSSQFFCNMDFTKFSAPELDLLMTICISLKEHQGNEISFTFAALREMSHFWSNQYNILEDTLISVFTKLQYASWCRFEEDGVVGYYPFLEAFVIDEEKHMLTVCKASMFDAMVNLVMKNISQSDLYEYVRLDGKYPKRLYVILKQHQRKRKVTMSINEFRTKMGVPQTYMNKDVMDKVIKPSVQALRHEFTNLSFNTVRNQEKSGRPAIGYAFTF